MITLDGFTNRPQVLCVTRSIAGLPLALAAAMVIIVSQQTNAQNRAAVPSNLIGDSVVVFLAPNTFAATPGSRQWYTVEVDSVKNLGAFQFDLLVKDTTATLDSMQLGAFFRNMPGRTIIPLPPGKKINGDTSQITFGGFSFGTAPGVNGHGALAKFRLSFPRVGTYTLWLKNVQIADITGALIPIKLLKSSRAIIAINQPPVINVSFLQPQMRFPEDDSLQVSLLNAAIDPNDSPTSLIWRTESGLNLRARFNQATKILTVASRQNNWNGQDTLKLTVEDPQGAKNAATFVVTVTPINDPPSIPQLLAPVWPQTSTVLKWSKSIDPDIGDVIRYQIQIAADSSFLTSSISLTAAMEEMAISVISSQLTARQIYYWRVQALDQQNANSGFSRKWSFRYEGNNVITEVEEQRSTDLPLAFALRQNYPNPITQSQQNAQTVIRIDLPKVEHVSLQIFNILGQSVRHLIDAEMPPGYHRMIWDGRNDDGKRVPAGVYFYRLKADNVNLARKLAVTQ
jgi:hypothetical protein